MIILKMLLLLSLIYTAVLPWQKVLKKLELKQVSMLILTTLLHKLTNKLLNKQILF